MVKKKKEEREIIEIAAPVTPLSPLYSNIVDVRSHKEFAMLDFGFGAPNYSKPDRIEITQIYQQRESLRLLQS